MEPQSNSKFSWSTVLLVGVGLITLVVAGLVAFKVYQTFGPKKTPETTTLTWWGLWEPKEVVEPLIAEYEKSHPTIKINYVFQAQQEYRERLQNALSSGRGPDIFRIHNSWVPMFKSDLASLPAEIMSTSEFEKTFYPVARADLRLGVGYVGVPLEIDGLAMFVNEKLLKGAGETPPQNWLDDIPRIAQKITKCETEDGQCRAGSKISQAGVALGTTDNVDHWQDIVALLMLQNNVNLANPTGKGAEDVLAYYTQFVRTDHVWDSTLPSSTRMFKDGRLAIYFAPSWRAYEMPANLDYKIYPVPQLPLGPGEQPTTWATYWVEGVNKRSAYTAQAWEFLRFLSSQSSLQKLYAQAVASGRSFGEPYSRVDMAETVKNAPLVGAYIAQAPQAKSWYLASFTWDGVTGINSLMNKYFADAVNIVNEGRGVAEATKTLSNGVNQVLSKYGLSTALPGNNQ